jgi:hypothetical protein
MKADAGRRYARGERAPEVAGGLARIVPAVEDEPEAGSIELELAEERIEDAEAGDTIRLIELIRRRKKTDSRIELGQRRS